MFIAVSGCIGAGKSTVCRVLSQITGFEPLYETVEGHPYLEKFYQNPREYAFRTQAFFLWDRFNKHYNALKSGKNLVADRSLYEDCIFARVLFQRGEMAPEDFQRTYLPHFNTLVSILEPPLLMIYLRAGLETLMYRIRKRARDMEKDIDGEYLDMLNHAYEEWIQEYPHRKLIIETDELDLTCDLHDDWLYMLQAMKMKVTEAMLSDVAGGIRQVIQQLPRVSRVPDRDWVRGEIFGSEATRQA